MPYGYADAPDPRLDPARRAGLLMIVNGVIGLLFGACFLGVGAMFGEIQWPAETAAEMRRLETQAGLPISVIFLVMGALAAVPSLVLFILGFFVRRGGVASIVSGIVVTSLVLLLLGLQLVGSFFSGPNALAGICMLSIPLALMILQLTWLIQAVRAAPRVRATRQNVQTQQSLYRQNQQQHLQPSPWPMQPPPPPPPSPPTE